MIWTLYSSEPIGIVLLWRYNLVLASAVIEVCVVIFLCTKPTWLLDHMELCHVVGIVAACVVSQKLALKQKCLIG